jgi:hypothetical protein
MDKELDSGKIYILKDPRDFSIRYVGKCEKKYLNTRLSAHLAPSNMKCSNHRTNWIRSLLCLGLKPEIELVQDGYKTRKELCDAEIFFIQFYKDMGLDLVNATKGGEGGSAKLFGDKNPARRPEVRYRVRKPISEETRARLSAAKAGKNHPFYGKRGKDTTQFGLKRTKDQNIKNAKAQGGKMFKDNLGNIYNTLGEAQDKTGADHRNISAVLHNKRKSTKGYIFVYLGDE